MDSTDDILLLDLETDGLLDELTRIWVLAIGRFGSDTVDTYTDYDPTYPALSLGIQRLRRHIKRGGKVAAHNGITFDYKVLKRLCDLEIPLEQGYDTLVMSRLYDPERLDHRLQSYGVESGILKGDHDDWTCYSEDMRAYCAQDIRVTQYAYGKVSKVLEWGTSSWIEHQIAYLIDLQVENGFVLDVERGIMLAAEISESRQRIALELQRCFPPQYVSCGVKTPKRTINYKAKKNVPAYSVTEGAPYTAIELQEFNPGSEFHVSKRLLAKYGWVCPLTEKGNPNITEAVLSKLPFPEAKLLTDFAREDKRYSQLAAPKKSNGTGGGWIHHADKNNRVHGRVNPNGAVTGRMTHSRPNSANIDKDPKLRSLWGPGPGKVQVGCDAEGIELRMLAHYLHPHDGGRLVTQLLEGDKSIGTDAHSMNRKNTELFSRDGAKTLLYGCLYGCGDEKAGLIWIADWRTSGKPESEWPAFALNAKGKLRAPEVIGKIVKGRLIDGIEGFGTLIEKVKATAKARGWLKGLDGRRIRVRSQHAALNSLLQGAGAVAMKVALIEYHNTTIELGWTHGVEFGYMANVHDEVQQETDPEIAETAGQTFAASITKAGVILGVKCRLDGAYAIGKNWYETH